MSRSFLVSSALALLAACDREANGGWIGDGGSDGLVPCQCEAREIGADEVVEEWGTAPADLSVFWAGAVDVEYELGGRTRGTVEIAPASATGTLYKAVRGETWSEDPYCQRVEGSSEDIEDEDLACPDLVLLDVRYTLETEDGVFAEEALAEDHELFSFQDSIIGHNNTSSGSYLDTRFEMEADVQSRWPLDKIVFEGLTPYAHNWLDQPLNGSIVVFVGHTDPSRGNIAWTSASWTMAE